ncbi:MAG: DinB family protein [Acidobacteriota bacterium]
MSHPVVFSLAESIQLLSTAPAVLDPWLRELPEAWLHTDEGPETFSPFEVLGHLIIGERTDWLVRTKQILDGRTEPFELFERFAHREAFAGWPIAKLLDLFASLRAANLEELRALQITEAQLDWTGQHPGLGEVTLRQLLAAWVVHDQGHIAQIARVLAKRYGAEVGPWTEYMPVLGDRVRE